ncbi:phosphotransferase [uncultured Marivirga sp.]|uniref:phosphotransferase n=1 Tax=uncultured Marivirga sp. TaxID=1123707 RepID=UPI0030ED7AEB|tara:strand:+ start:190164 stop:191135 length:972 start_codon:yes stop_codon:yes gene_type:complete
MVEVTKEIVAITKASKIIRSESVQTLWSGYGEIRRYFLEGGKYTSVIVKHIQLPDAKHHPKGWNTPLSHQRKLKSYQVERQWYQEYADKTDAYCRVPQSYHAVEAENELLLIMEDLDASGYPFRLHHNEVTLDHAKSCLSWLAHFHAKFMNTNAKGLWEVGTYWHLETRPDEWERMENTSLKNAASLIDEKLQNAQYQTIIHGDAKLANFCFAEDGTVAAVDFQYVGQGCGMKDVAYFISSCFEEEKCEKYEEELLQHYFSQLKNALDNTIDYPEVKKEWSELYRYSWADFYRFLDGWSPGHWKMHEYSKKLTQIVLKELKVK